MFRALLVPIAAVVFSVSCFAQVETWKIDPNHTAAQFSVRHMAISTVRGAFTKVSGEVAYDPKDVTKTTIQATIEADSIDTRVSKRDDDLRANYFEVAKYPTIIFKSKQAQPAGEGKLKVTGDLTIHGVTKEVVLDVDGPSQAIQDPRGNFHMGASASTKISRKDFGITNSPGVIGDDIEITIDTEMIKPGPSAK